MTSFNLKSIAACTAIAASLLVVGSAQAAETIKLGVSMPLTGPAAPWGIGSEWLCEKAVDEIEEAGGVQVGGETYNFKCLAYDNKYNAAGGTRVAQTLLNREGVEFIVASLGTAPTRALQSLAERQDALLFNVAWGQSIKGPDHPLTFTLMNTPLEILPPFISFITQKYPEAETVALINPNDATGKDAAVVGKKLWQEAGLEVVSSIFYERGTTAFQPVAAKLAALDPDIISLGAGPPATAGIVFKALETLGWEGIKIYPAGTSVETIRATGGEAVNGVYLGSAVNFSGESATEYQRKVNEAYRADIGAPLNAISLAAYNGVYALAAAMEKAQSTKPKEVAAVLPNICFHTFYGGKASFGGKKTYGYPQQILIPVIVTQIRDGQLVEVARLPVQDPKCSSEADAQK